ncbi:hypothetical protein GCM10020216_092320 [Nonomuraea helvata]
MLDPAGIQPHVEGGQVRGNVLRRYVSHYLDVGPAREHARQNLADATDQPEPRLWASGDHAGPQLLDQVRHVVHGIGAAIPVAEMPCGGVADRQLFWSFAALHLLHQAGVGLHRP